MRKRNQECEPAYGGSLVDPYLAIANGSFGAATIDEIHRIVSRERALDRFDGNNEGQARIRDQRSLVVLQLATHHARVICQRHQA